MVLSPLLVLIVKCSSARRSAAAGWHHSSELRCSLGQEGCGHWALQKRSGPGGSRLCRELLRKTLQAPVECPQRSRVNQNQTTQACQLCWSNDSEHKDPELFWNLPLEWKKGAVFQIITPGRKGCDPKKENICTFRIVLWGPHPGSAHSVKVASSNLTHLIHHTWTMMSHDAWRAQTHSDTDAFCNPETYTSHESSHTLRGSITC